MEEGVGTSEQWPNDCLVVNSGQEKRIGVSAYERVGVGEKGTGWRVGVSAFLPNADTFLLTP